VNQRDVILKRVKTVETLPSASAQIISLVQDPDTPSDKIAQALEYDPSLTTNILRMANSARFGLPQSVSTVKDALFRLGRQVVLEMVVAVSVKSTFKEPIKGYDVAGSDLWDHVVGTAIGAIELGKILDIKVPAHTFTAALLHDVGKIVLGMFVEVDSAAITEMAFEEEMSFEVAERLVLGIDHTEVGAALLTAWNLPEYIVDIVRWHHQPENCPEDPVVVNLVHAADFLSLMAGMGKGIDGLNYKPSDHVMSKLRISSSVSQKVIYRILKALDELRETFSFE